MQQIPVPQKLLPQANTPAEPALPKQEEMPPVQSLPLEPAKPVVPEQPAPVVTAAGEHTLRVDARDVVWMKITFANNHSEEILMRPGASKSWRYSGRAVLKVGNAGGIRVNLDDKDLGSPGASGQVMSLTFPPSP
jgi:uncharacterized membrane protein